MKKLIKKFKMFYGVLFLLLGIALNSNAAGLLKPLSGNDSEIIMKSHHVKVIINNGFAKTEVDQIFQNNGNVDKEALYVFPLPTKASLSEVSFWVDGKEILGEVMEKEEAKKTYLEQKAKGNNTVLAEKDDYKRFEIRIYPVRANSDTRVRLVYYQPINIELNIGRYVYHLEEGGNESENSAFWSIDNKVKESFKFDLELKSVFPIKGVRVPDYKQAVIKKFQSDSEEMTREIYKVSIDSAEEGIELKKDIVVYYRLDDDVPARVELIPYKENLSKAGTFMLVVTPGATLNRIPTGCDWAFVLDVSGSMDGSRIATLVEGVGKVISQLSDKDRFRIITFNNRVRDFSGGYINATKSNINDILQKIKSIRADGSTALYAGLEMAYEGFDSNRTTGIILVTDGVANVGPTQQSNFLALHKKYDIRLFTFVIGNSANSPLLERLARDSGGFAMNISTSDEVIGRIIQAKAMVFNECIYDAEINFSGNEIIDITPSKIGNIYVGQQIVMFGRYRDAGEITIELKGKIGGNEQVWKCSANLPEMDIDNPEIERLWALSQIEGTMEVIREKGVNQDLKKKVVELGTEFSIVTDYTSMIVLQEEESENAGLQNLNANRVAKEREAEAQKLNKPIKSYRADNNPPSNNQTVQRQNSNQGMFKGVKSPNIGSGPVGPIFVIIAAWAMRRKQKKY
ncbi:MAG: VWA domain-containing protein [Desulfobacterales bacterium]|nr:VWA domain-containing protein [Desulfobacterales bacterium]